MRRQARLVPAFFAAVLFAAPAPAQEARTQERAAMVAGIEAHARLAPQAVKNGVIGPAVLQAMRARSRATNSCPRPSGRTPMRTVLCRSDMVRQSRNRSSSR
jgi:hypothetical protein